MDMGHRLWSFSDPGISALRSTREKKKIPLTETMLSLLKNK